MSYKMAQGSWVSLGTYDIMSLIIVKQKNVEINKCISSNFECHFILTTNQLHCITNQLH